MYVLNALCRASLAFCGYLFFTCAVFAADDVDRKQKRIRFDEKTCVTTYADWQAAATNPAGKLAQWQPMPATTAGMDHDVLSISRIHDTSSSVFNLCWAPGIKFQQGELEVRVRANTGEIDQGGGLIWRVQDANNYYIARFNPLENNFRLYYVKQGRRVQLASKSFRPIPAGSWFHIRVTHAGNHIKGWFNNNLAWEVNDDQITQSGGIGLWTKADAASSFRDLIVRQEENATKTSEVQ